jgi:hypothetical protein
MWYANAPYDINTITPQNWVQSIYNQMVAAAGTTLDANPPLMLTPAQWNSYLAQVLPSNVPVPPVSVVFKGTNPDTPMPAGAYWPIIGTALLQAYAVPGDWYPGIDTPAEELAMSTGAFANQVEVTDPNTGISTLTVPGLTIPTTSNSIPMLTYNPATGTTEPVSQYMASLPSTPVTTSGSTLMPSTQGSSQAAVPIVPASTSTPAAAALTAVNAAAQAAASQSQNATPASGTDWTSIFTETSVAGIPNWVWMAAATVLLLQSNRGKR